MKSYVYVDILNILFIQNTCKLGSNLKKKIIHEYVIFQIKGQQMPVGTSNIRMTKLKFDLTLFKSLECLEV